MKMPSVFDDGGRAAAGIKGRGSDCVTRSIAIATGIPYMEVAYAIKEAARRERPRKGRERSHWRFGVWKRTYHKYITSLGWLWMPTMFVGSGCLVHMRSNELPAGRLIVSLSGHMTCVIDGVIHDSTDDEVSRDGTRCVYGYYYKP